MNRDIEFWGAIAGILGCIVAILAFVRDLFNPQVKWEDSKNFFKRLIVNRWFLIVTAVGLLGFFFWSLYDRIQSLESILTDREAEITSAYATQTMQLAEFANKPASTPEIREVPVTVEVEREVTVLAPTYTPLPTYTPFPPLPTYTLPALPPTPTATRVVPKAPTPTITPTEDVPTPDTRLKVRESWTEKGVSLTLNEVNFLENGNIEFDLVFENKTGGTIAFSWDANNVSLIDNLGNRYSQPWCNNDELVLKAGESFPIRSCNRTGGWLVFNSNKEFFNQAVTEMTFAAKGMSRIEQAQWKIIIPH